MFSRLIAAIKHRHHNQKAIKPARLVIGDEGIAIVFGGGDRHESFPWDEVVEIQTFKVDYFAYDSICLQFSTAESSYVFEEEDHGFSELMKAMRERYPDVPKDWYNDVMCPAFKTNPRLLWKRND